MRSKFLIAATLVLGGWFIIPGASAQSQQTHNELLKFCSRFPKNSKCKGIEPPISLKERSGEEVNCSFVFDPGEFEQRSDCKIIMNEDSVTVYQEQGDKLELLEEERATVIVKMPRDRIFITNYQIWNKIHRWEVGFLPEENSEGEHQTNFMVMLMNESIAESVAGGVEAFSSSQPEIISELTANQDQQTADLTVLMTTKVCEYCDLRGADLVGADLKGVNLQGANLEGANLVGADLESAYLLGANLEGANLTAADLRGANLTFANLNQAILISTDFAGANFQQANLSEANLEGADLSAPTFLQEANLNQANLTDADLSGANLQRANLEQANLTGADLSHNDVKLKNIPNNYSTAERLGDLLIGLPIFGFSSGGVDFDTDFTGANLAGANLSSTNLKRIVFKDANLTNVDFTESNLKEEALAEAKVCGVTLADGSTSDRDCDK
ncbi:MAG: pentapeptide repeat-containing protein [Cyanobacteria bacterium J06621_8]